MTEPRWLDEDEQATWQAYLASTRLLEETRANHLGKLAFRHVYWNVLLPGLPVPLPAHMSMAGKQVPHADNTTAAGGMTP